MGCLQSHDSTMANNLGTILLAEDNEDDVLLLKLLLAKCGVLNPLQVVSNGEEVMAYLQGQGIYANRERYPRPILLLLDWKLPLMDGLDVLNSIQRQPELAVATIVLTGYPDLREMNETYRSGARTFLTKPLDDQDCRRVICSFKGVEV